MEKNLDEAVKWLRKAAELGHKDAMVKLGELLSGTEEPFTKLLEKSYMEGYADCKNGKANKYLKEADIKSRVVTVSKLLHLRYSLFKCNGLKAAKKIKEITNIFFMVNSSFNS